LKQGLIDVAELLGEAVREVEPPSEPEPLEAFQKLDADLHEIGRLLERRPTDFLACHDWLRQIEKHASGLPERARELSQLIKECPEEIQLWADRLQAQVGGHLEDIEQMLPWLAWVARNGPGISLESEHASRWHSI